MIKVTVVGVKAVGLKWL